MWLCLLCLIYQLMKKHKFQQSSVQVFFWHWFFISILYLQFLTGKYTQKILFDWKKGKKEKKCWQYWWYLKFSSRGSVIFSRYDVLVLMGLSWLYTRAFSIGSVFEYIKFWPNMSKKWRNKWMRFISFRNCWRVFFSLKYINKISLHKLTDLIFITGFPKY